MTEKEKIKIYNLALESPIEVLKVHPLIYKGRPTMYEIDTLGNIYSHYTKRFLSTHLNNNGYLSTSIQINGINKLVMIHKLVAETFIPNPNNLPIVNHKDGDKSNPYIKNLEWTTYKENTAHAMRNGLLDHNKINYRRGIESPKNIHSEELIHHVCKLLEEGYGSTEISRILPEIDIKSVDSIKRKHNWVHISSKYNIPDPKHRIPLSDEIKAAIVNLVYNDYRVKDIMNILNLPRNSYIREQVAWIRRKIITAKPSTTIDQSIEEVILK